MHRKILDAIFAWHLNAHRLDTGAQAFLIDPYAVENAARVAHNPGWLRGMLQDMITARVTLDFNNGMHYDGTIISEFWKSTQQAEMPGGALTGTRSLWVVVVSAGWMALYDTSLIMKYRNLMPMLNQITDGTTHALALHVLTHSSARNFVVMHVLAVIGAVTANTTPDKRRRIQRQILAQETTLGRLGIRLYRAATGQMMLSYVPTSGVYFQNPISRK